MALDIENDKYGTRMHQGLEYFLWKMSLPNTPSYNINTDLKYGVRLWFHNGIGNIMNNPFLSLAETKYGDFRKNFEFKEHGHRGLELNANWKEHPDGEGVELSNPELGDLCFDLTPFVQSITLPPIGTNTETKVETLLGQMQVGSYSPYTSDGGQEIQFTVIDTQYSILDAIFYPWLKMIGTPDWYDPGHAYEQHTTPYPICTVEISTPMRWSPDPKNGRLDDRRKEATLIPYVYQYIGARPKSYDIPEINAEQRSTLTRTLRMVCDLVIVDLNKDAFKNRIRDEGEAKSVKHDDSLFSHLNLGLTDFLTPELTSPESQAMPTAEDVNAAAAAAEQAQTDKDQAEQAALDQELGGEPGAAAAAGPPDPNPAPTPTPTPETPPVSSDTMDNTPVAASASPTPEPPVTPAGMATRSITRDDEEKETTSDKVCKEIKTANTKHHGILASAKKCIVEHGSDYAKSPILGKLRDEIPQQFDSLLVTPLLDSVKDPATVVKVQDQLDSATDSKKDPTKHHYRFDLADAKAIGNVIMEVQPVTRDPIVGNYGKVKTMKEAVVQIQRRLPKVNDNAAEAFFAINALKSLEQTPNSSMSFYWDDAMELWPVGLYLAPLHNALASVMGLSNSETLEGETYPYLFRTSWYKDTFSESEAFVVLRDALKMQEQERMERELGTLEGVKFRIEHVSLWEIVDDHLNHTGTYWCKAWLVGERNPGVIDTGIIVICKMDYRGTILTDPISCDGETMMEFGQHMVCSKASFTKATNRAIFSANNQWEVKKGGQNESDFKPLSAIKRSKEYSFTTEYEKVPGARDDDDSHDNLRPTHYVHIEEWPREGDPEADMDEDGFYTLSTMDEYGVMKQTHYKVDRKTAYDAQQEIDKEQREVLPLRMGQCLRQYHTSEGSYSRLMVKRHDCWDGEPSKGRPYVVIHTTNAEEDMFDQYIPSSVDYVAQYKHHKRRWRTARSELLKLRQLIARLSAKLTQLGNEMQEGKEFIARVVTEEKVQKLLKANATLEEISGAYNSLIDSELKQEANLTELKATGDAISGKYNSTPDTNLPSKLSLVDDLHLQNLSIARVEEELKSIRDKEAELEAKYRQAVKDKDDAIKELGTDIDTIYEIISSCMCNSWLTTLLWKGHAQEVEYLKTKEDRRVKMERLIVFFDERIKQIEKALDDDPGNVQLKDVILECDWKAWGDWAEEETPEVQRIRETANKLGYKLRVNKLIPKLRKRWNQAVKHSEKISQEAEESTALIYDTQYAYPGYVPKDESTTKEQEPISMRSVKDDPKVKALDSIIKEYEKTFVKGTKKVKPIKVASEVDVKKAKNEVLRVYRTLHDGFQDCSEAELENSLLLVLSSGYLKEDDEGKAFQDEVIAARTAIEMSKRVLEGFKQMADEEVKMISAARQKCDGIRSSIEKIDKVNAGLIRKSGNGLSQDQYQDFRLNTLKKVDLQQSLDSMEATTKDLLKHYEESTMKTLSSYADELEQARSKYDSLMKQLKERIDFNDKMVMLSKALDGDR